MQDHNEHDGEISVEDRHQWQVGYSQPAKEQFYPPFLRAKLQEDTFLLQPVKGHVRSDLIFAGIGDSEVPTTA